MTPRTVLIAGCGDVGNALGARLLADGVEVHGLRRNVTRLAAGIRPLAADLSVLAGFAAPAVDAVVYAATPDHGDDEGYRRSYVLGQRNLKAALERVGVTPARWLFVSSTGVYAQGDGEWVDEDSPTAPGRYSGRRLLEGERAAAEAAAIGVSIRFGGIYGPGRNRLIERVRDGGLCHETPPLWTNRIHRDDCAGVLRHLLRLPSPAPVYVGVDHEPAPQCAVMDWLATRLGVARPQRAAHDDAPTCSGKRCSSVRLQASGYCFIPSYREGYAAVLDARRVAGDAGPPG